jgi:hypothetical protein
MSTKGKEFGDVISKLKNVNKQATTDELQLGGELFQVNSVKTNSISTDSLSGFFNKRSVIVATIVSIVYILLNLSMTMKLVHKYIKNETVIKAISIFIIFAATLVSLKFLSSDDN